MIINAGMTHPTKAVLLALSLVAGPGCGGASGEPPPVMVDARLAMKCSFSSKSGTHAMPGEAFLYLLYDSTDGAFVVHGLARDREDLASEELGLWGDLPPHTAVRTGTGHEWTERDADGDKVTNWIGRPYNLGELFINSGVSHLAQVAYPACFAREL